MIITNSEQLAEALVWLEQQEYVAYDTETDSLNTRKGTIIGFGISNTTSGYYFPIKSWNGSVLQHVDLDVGPVLSALLSKKLLCWNASFDLRFTKNNFGVDLVPALHADVMLMVHTCDENRYSYQLKELGAELYGQDAKKEKAEMQASIKANGGTAKEYYKANTDILGRYCIQDCALTFKLFTHYSNQLNKEGLEKFYYIDEVLPLYKEVTIPMEEAGIKLDMEGLRNSLIEIRGDIKQVQAEIQTSIAPHLSAVFESWFLNKDYPLATYTGRVPAWRTRYKTQLEAWQGTGESPYMFNLLSKHHLKKLFFDTLKEVPLSRTPKGAPQVDEEFLELMGAKYAWAKQLIVYNKLIKLKGTYIERFIDEAEDGIFYPSFQQHRTVSGRYSGDLQQLPRPANSGTLDAKYTNRIRSFFISDSQCTLMSADYEQLEPRTFAHVSRDPALAAIFNENKDFYSEGAALIEGIPLEQITKEQRQRAKVYMLGIAYGMTGYKLKFEIGCEQDEADWLVQKYLGTFPALAYWMENSKNIARADGLIRSDLGRVRRLGRIQQIYAKYGHCIEHDLELWKQLHEMPALYETAKRERREYKNYLNNAINFQIQSMAASIMNRASIAIARQLKREGLKSQIVANVHDELVLHVPISEQHRVAHIVKHEMENVVKLSVPLKTTPQCGTNYKNCK